MTCGQNTAEQGLLIFQYLIHSLSVFQNQTTPHMYQHPPPMTLYDQSRIIKAIIFKHDLTSLLSGCSFEANVGLTLSN